MSQVQKLVKPYYKKALTEDKYGSNPVKTQF